MIAVELPVATSRSASPTCFGITSGMGRSAGLQPLNVRAALTALARPGRRMTCCQLRSRLPVRRLRACAMRERTVRHGGATIRIGYDATRR